MTIQSEMTKLAHHQSFESFSDLLDFTIGIGSYPHFFISIVAIVRWYGRLVVTRPADTLSDRAAQWGDAGGPGGQGRQSGGEGGGHGGL